MRILQVIPYFTPVLGGSVSIAYNLSIELSKMGHQLCVATSDYMLDENFIARAESHGIEVRTFHCTSNAGMFFFTPGIKKWLDTEIDSYDLIHLHNFRSYQNVVVPKYARLRKKPYALQAHGSVPRLVDKKIRKWLFDSLWGFNIIRDAEALLAVSDIEVNQYVQFGAKDNQIHVVPNGVVIPSSSRKTEDRLSIRRRLNINEGDGLILFLGRIHRIKGLDFLLRAFQALLKENPNTVLVVAGPDCGYLSQLRTLANQLRVMGKIRFLDYVEDVSPIYQAADLLVYPAEYEIFGLVPFEALLCGTPVIVTAGCGCGNLIKNADCGLVVRYGDIEQLKQQMRLIIENPGIGKEMVERGRIYIMENLTWKSTAQKMERVYEDCVHNL
jgi:glycosyltransferase involved in cell wall biosynthesis